VFSICVVSFKIFVRKCGKRVFILAMFGNGLDWEEVNWYYNKFD
jgi:hypothetical protein